MLNPEIIPGNANVAMHLLFSVGFTPQGQIGCYWHPGPWKPRLRELPPQQKQAIKDTIVKLVVDALNREVPGIITVT